MPFFLISWMVCAVGFAVRAGYLMAKADGADKANILDKMLPPKPKP